jgi:hypothetical protein
MPIKSPMHLAQVELLVERLFQDAQDKVEEARDFFAKGDFTSAAARISWAKERLERAFQNVDSLR